MIVSEATAYRSGLMIYSNKENRELTVTEVERELVRWGIKFDNISIQTTFTNG